MKNFGIKKGDIFDGNTVANARVFGDILVVWLTEELVEVYPVVAVEKGTKTKYRIDGKTVIKASMPPDSELLILETEKGIYYRDFDNQQIPDSENWVDYYLEPIKGQFYRKYPSGEWFGIEGYRLWPTVFLQDDVLVSLEQKTSRQSVAFIDKKIVISAGHCLIQAGRIVMDRELNIISLYGEKVTSLGNQSIAFKNGEQLQEVLVGLHQKRFLFEDTGKPYFINDELINDYLGPAKLGAHYFELFASDRNKYAVRSDSSEVFCCNDQPVFLIAETFTSIKNKSIVACQQKADKFMIYLDGTPLRLPGFSDHPIEAVEDPVFQIHQSRVRNIRVAGKPQVYDETAGAIFTIDDQSPDRISDPQHYSTDIGIAYFGEATKLFLKKTRTLLRLPDGTSIQEITSGPHQKLLNAKDENGQPVVLDIRKGFEYLTIATVDEKIITEVFDQPRKMGLITVQNVAVKTLGGQTDRVVNLDEPELELFTLPDQFTTVLALEDASLFQSSEILRVDYSSVTELGDMVLVEADFIAYTEASFTVLIDQITGQPLHLEGANHKIELVTGLLPTTLKKEFFIGRHRMISAHTLTEELQARQLLFALDSRKTWLPFQDNVLPAFSKLIDLRGTTTWGYRLCEIANRNGKRELVAIESKPPYRILVEKSRTGAKIKLIDRNAHKLRTPQERSLFLKIFMRDPGVLVEVE